MNNFSLNKSDLNLNNKFESKCTYPALMSDEHYFTNFVSSRLFNDGLQKNLNAKGSNNYREILQNGAATIIGNEIYQYEKTRCKSDNQNIFYIDQTKNNPNKALSDEYQGQKILNHGIKKSEPASF